MQKNEKRHSTEYYRNDTRPFSCELENCFIFSSESYIIKILRIRQRISLRWKRKTFGEILTHNFLAALRL